MKEIIIANASAAQLRIAAINKSMKPLNQDRVLKCVKGISTIEEVMRVTNND